MLAKARRRHAPMIWAEPRKTAPRHTAPMPEGREPPWFFAHDAESEAAYGLALAGTLVTPFPPHRGALTEAETACVETMAAKLASLHRAGRVPVGDISTVWINRTDDDVLPQEVRDPAWLRARMARYLTVRVTVPRATDGAVH